MPDTIIYWLWGLGKAIPEDIIKGLIASFLILLIIKLVNKVKFLTSKIKNIILKLFNTKIEISTKTTFIESPDYHYTTIRRVENVRSENSNDNDVFLLIIAGVFVASIVVSFFKEYVDYISLFLKWFGLIPLMICILFLFVISISQEVQKVTVKFITVSIVVSALTLYYGLNLKEMATTMSATITDGRNLLASLYKIFGVFIGVIQQLISYILLLRVISVYIDRKKKKPIQLVRRFIAKTKQFESVMFLSIIVIFLSILSYAFTLEAVHKFLLRQ